MPEILKQKLAGDLEAVHEEDTHSVEEILMFWKPYFS